MTMHRIRAAFCCFVLLIASCGQSNGDVGVAAPEDAAAMANALGGVCDEPGGGERSQLIDIVTASGAWYLVPSISLGNVESSASEFTGVVRTSGLLSDASLIGLPSSGTDLGLGSDAEINMTSIHYDQIGVLVAAGADLLVLVQDRPSGPFVRSAAAISHGEAVSFIGRCADLLYTQKLRSYHAETGSEGTELSALMELSESSDARDVYLAIGQAPPWSDTPAEQRVLDEERMAESDLSGLQTATIRVTVPDSIADSRTVLCAFVVDRGWGNLCTRLRESLLDDGAFEIETLAATGDRVEIWILESAAPLGRPLAQLGSIEVTESDFTDAIRLVVSDDPGLKDLPTDGEAPLTLIVLSRQK